MTSEQTMRTFLSGNEAIARGAWEAGVTFATGYPGTPSTEILERLVGYDGIDCHWAANEKVAFEEGMGFALAGGRALVTMKHVGLNVASDAFMVFPYSGTNGGFVVVSADDPGMHSSQNEQDNRFLARMARVPVIEPAEPQECKDFLHEAYALSESYGTPVMFRTTTRTAHCKGSVRFGQRSVPERRSFEPDPKRYSVPIYRQRLRPLLEERWQKLERYAAATQLNRASGHGSRVGAIANGISRSYAREVLPTADVFDLGMTWPLPMQALEEFCAAHEVVYVIEEGDPFVEEQLRAAGIRNVVGKSLFGVIGEYSPERLARALAGSPEAPGAPAGAGSGTGGGARASASAAASLAANRANGDEGANSTDGDNGAGAASGATGQGTDAEPAAAPPPTPRPPMFCIGCGHRTVFDVLGQLKLLVAGDIGCYTMGALYPYEAEHTTFCMGASISTAVGFQRAGQDKAVAVIGDSTFLHGGIPAMLDAVYTRTPVTVLILDNGTTGMTGQQSHPGSGNDLSGAEAPRADIPKLVAGLGVEHVAVVDTWDRKGIRRAILAARGHGGPAVVVIQGPCQLLPEMRARDQEPLQVVESLCTDCDACYRIRCPAITPAESGLPEIDAALCVTCNVCADLCMPGAIVTASRAVELEPVGASAGGGSSASSPASPMTAASSAASAGCAPADAAAATGAEALAGLEAAAGASLAAFELSEIEAPDDDDPPISVLIAGVGGQGVLLIAEMLALAAVEAGFEAKQTEIHGVSQRGGSVHSHVRFGRAVHSPLIPFGSADIVVALEKLEGLRFAPFVAEDGVLLVDEREVMPISAGPAAAATYPHDAVARIAAMGRQAVAVQATISARERLGNERAANVLMLGRMASRLPIPRPVWDRVLEQRVPPRYLDLNRRAFEFGYAEG